MEAAVEAALAVLSDHAELQELLKQAQKETKDWVVYMVLLKGVNRKFLIK